MKTLEEIASDIVALRTMPAYGPTCDPKELKKEIAAAIQAERDAQAKRIAELEKALAPFADYGTYWSAPDKYIKPEKSVGEFNGRGFMVTSFPLTHAHCRHAAEVLKGGKV